MELAHVVRLTQPNLSLSTTPTSSSEFGELVHLTAVVLDDNGSAIAGYVSFEGEGLTAFGSHPVPADGRVSVQLAQFLPVGTYHYTASFSPSLQARYSSATAELDHTIGAAQASVALTVSGGHLRGNEVTLTAAVSPAPSHGGEVTFLDGDQELHTMPVPLGGSPPSRPTTSRRARTP